VTNALAEPGIEDVRLGIGGNLPPLGEQLAEEIAPLRDRADDLIAVAETAVIIDTESAEKVINLGQLMAALEKELDAAREARGKPFLEAKRAVDGAYNPLIGKMRAGRDALRAMLNTFRQKIEAEAEAQRQAALAEQRRREEEAAAAAERAMATANVSAALASLKAQEEAAAAARRVEAIRPEPLRAQLGSLGSQRSIAFDIADTRKLVAWMVKQPMKGNLDQALRTIMGAYLRQLGVDAVARGIEIPGLSAWVDTNAAIRR
jgi:hypothetical protein